MNIFAYGIYVVITVSSHLGNVTVLSEFFTVIVASRREGHDLFAKPHQVFGLACHYHDVFIIISVVERTYSYRIPGCDVFVSLCVVNDAGKFRVQHGEHICAVFFIKREENFTVAVAFKGIFRCKLRAKFFKAIDLAVADAITAT